MLAECKKERTIPQGRHRLFNNHGQRLLERWKRYFDNLLNCNGPEEMLTFNTINDNKIECPAPTLEEIEMQIKMLRNNKTTGEDGIQA